MARFKGLDDGSSTTTKTRLRHAGAALQAIAEQWADKLRGALLRGRLAIRQWIATQRQNGWTKPSTAPYWALYDRSSATTQIRLRHVEWTMRAIAIQWATALCRMARLAAATVGMMVLTGCATPEIKGLCPSYVHYSQQDDQAVLAELRMAEAAGQNVPTTHRYLRDYGKQRAALRVICTGS